MNQKYNRNSIQKFYGLSTDIKPVAAEAGSIFTEVDTGDNYIFNKSSLAWTKIPSGGGSTPVDLIPITKQEVYNAWNHNAIVVTKWSDGEKVYFSTISELSTYLHDNISSDYIDVEIGDGVSEEIEYTLFSQNSRVRNVIIGASIANIPSALFSQCVNLNTAVIRCPIEEIPTSCFNGCMNLISCVIPDTVRTISGGAFSGTQYLSSFTFPKRLEVIKGGAFTASSITHVRFNDALKEIENGAFSENSGAYVPTKYIEIPASIQTIGANAFSGLSHVDKIVVHKNSGDITGAPWGAMKKNGTEQPYIDWVGGAE